MIIWDSGKETNGVVAGLSILTDLIPGLHNREDVQITFIDVARVSGVIFDIRRQ